MARLTSTVFVTALIRRINGAGGNAVIAQKGSAEAGAVYVAVWSASSRDYELYEPDMSAGNLSDAIGGRAFRIHPMRFQDAELAERFEAESRFDPDLWLVEIDHLPSPVDDLITVTPGS